MITASCLQAPLAVWITILRHMGDLPEPAYSPTLYDPCYLVGSTTINPHLFKNNVWASEATTQNK